MSQRDDHGAAQRETGSDAGAQGRRHVPVVPYVLERAAAKPDLVTEDNGVSFMLVSAAGGAVRTLLRLQAELDTGRRVSVVATPKAAAWFDHYEIAPVIERMTGFPLRCEMPTPTMPTFDPPGSRVLISPCSLNTLTKWAAAHSDNLVISLLCEAVGKGVPVRAEVSLSDAYLAHPAAIEALEILEGLGVELYQAFGTVGHRLLRPLPTSIVEYLTP